MLALHLLPTVPSAVRAVGGLITVRRANTPRIFLALSVILESLAD